jgi:hypothetical protein
VPISSLLESIDFALHMALEVRYGIEVQVNEFGEGAIVPAQRVLKIITRYRKEMGDVSLNDLLIDLHPDDPDHKIWIYKASLVFPGAKSVHTSAVPEPDPPPDIEF